MKEISRLELARILRRLGVDRTRQTTDESVDVPPAFPVIATVLPMATSLFRIRCGKTICTGTLAVSDRHLISSLPKDVPVGTEIEASGIDGGVTCRGIVQATSVTFAWTLIELLQPASPPTVPVPLSVHTTLQNGDRLIGLLMTGTDGVAVETGKVQAISDVTAPSNILGPFTFSSMAVPDRSSIGSPVFDTDGSLTGLVVALGIQGVYPSTIAPVAAFAKAIIDRVSNIAAGLVE